MSVTRLHGASPRFVILNDSNAYRGDAGSLRQPVRKGGRAIRRQAIAGQLWAHPATCARLIRKATAAKSGSESPQSEPAPACPACQCGCSGFAPRRVIA